jgi:hypothetical protein
LSDVRRRALVLVCSEVDVAERNSICCCLRFLSGCSVVAGGQWLLTCLPHHMHVVSLTWRVDVGFFKTALLVK